MQRVRKKGFALINTIIMISLLMSISSLMFSLMKNNIDISSMYCIDDDIFSVDNNEEKVIYEFMRILNNKNENLKNNEHENEDLSVTSDDEYENLSNVSNKVKYIDFEEGLNVTDIFYEDFEEENKGNKLKYEKSADKITLKIYGKYNSLRVRELKYVIKNDRIILLPTSNFIDTNTDFDKL